MCDTTVSKRFRGMFVNSELVQDDEVYAGVNAYRGDREHAIVRFWSD
jgi:hypothetical protein